MDWTALQLSTAEYFSASDLVRGFSADDILKLSPDTNKLYLGPIDWAWGKTDQDIDETLNNAKTEYLFRCNQVDTLINEAGMLIERSLSDLMKYDELNVERLSY
jgi:hypothetical protein